MFYYFLDLPGRDGGMLRETAHFRGLDRKFTALLASPLPTWAGSFSVSPVRLALSAKQPVASVTVRNDGSEPSVVPVSRGRFEISGG